MSKTELLAKLLELAIERKQCVLTNGLTVGYFFAEGDYVPYIWAREFCMYVEQEDYKSALESLAAQMV